MVKRLKFRTLAIALHTRVRLMNSSEVAADWHDLLTHISYVTE